LGLRVSVVSRGSTSFPTRRSSDLALRAYKVQPGGKAVGLRVAEAESLVPDARLFILRIRRGGEIMDATADIVLKEGDVVAVAGRSEEHTSELQSPDQLVCRLLLEK